MWFVKRCWSPVSKRQGQETWYFHVRSAISLEESRGLSVSHPFFETLLWNSPIRFRDYVIQHQNDNICLCTVVYRCLNSCLKEIDSDSSFTSSFFLSVNTISSKETGRFPIKQLVHFLRIPIESGSARKYPFRRNETSLRDFEKESYLSSYYSIT